MFRHVALFRWSAPVDDATRASVEAALGALPHAIGTVRAYAFGPDAGVNTGNFDFAVVADFDDRESYVVYRDHPAHQRVLEEVLAPLVTERAAVQLELPGTGSR